jgi:Mrp family chromosome partitioning ATPase
MTIINRALTKAYRRRSDAEPGKTREEHSPSATGWATMLREPLRPISSPDLRSARPVVSPTTSVEIAAPSGAHGGSTVQFDPFRAVAKPQARPDARPGIEPAVLAAPRSESAAAAPPDQPAGTTVRIDPGHASARPQATLEAQAAESKQARAAGDRIAVDAAPRWSWPPIVGKLLDCSAGAELRRLAASLKHLAVTRGLVCMALSGPGRSTGRTSLLLTLAHLLAETQFSRVAIVDADFGHPQAADLLSLRPGAGLWEAACEKNEAAAQVVTPLIEGKLSLVPLLDRVPIEAVDRRKIAALQTFLRSLRRENDLVLLDAGPWETIVPPLVFESRAVDALLCVARCGSGEAPLDDEQYRQPGMEWLGMIETFVPAQRLKQWSAGGPTS